MTRFAPSPTGRLHLGHAYSAILAHDYARAKGGQFLLRIEDIDTGRCRPEHIQSIYDDLHWLGLNWDGGVLLQSQRTAAYDAALYRLQAMGLVYRCWCTRAEIAAAAASAPQGQQVIYPGTCRNRKDGPEGAAYAWRLNAAAALAQTGPLTWTDSQAGPIVAQPELLGDVIIARKDAGTSYHIAVVTDDAAQGVTDIVRGRDLFDSTHIHRLLQALLDLPVPLYHHHDLILDGGGDRLAKRRGSESLADLREAGLQPDALLEGLRRGRFPAGYSSSYPA